eukprot:COSAG02_NODE_1880_length_10551_cov_2.925947_6_plen_72_part_00
MHPAIQHRASPCTHVGAVLTVLCRHLLAERLRECSSLSICCNFIGIKRVVFPRVALITEDRRVAPAETPVR